MKNESIIRSIVQNHLSISEQSLSAFLKIVALKVIPKKTAFIQKNKTDQSEYFILNGICRSFVSNGEGELITISFFQEKSVISPHVIRTSNNISTLSFETITDTLIGVVDSNLFLELMIKNLEIRSFANMVLQQELVQKVNKEINMASLSAKERLVHFRKTHSNLENLIPHEMIASYLGITTISLSRIRKEISLNC